MAEHFMVIDFGSNAPRCQVAAVAHVRRYRVLE
jgi:hypothetical protein